MLVVAPPQMPSSFILRAATLASKLLIVSVFLVCIVPPKQPPPPSFSIWERLSGVRCFIPFLLYAIPHFLFLSSARREKDNDPSLDSWLDVSLLERLNPANGFSLLYFGLATASVNKGRNVQGLGRSLHRWSS